jgi:hypothetical protein
MMQKPQTARSQKLPLPSSSLVNYGLVRLRSYCKQPEAIEADVSQLNAIIGVER